VGKTDLSIKIAKQLDTEIISADSRQLYKEMNIGTAKPSAEELAKVPHHFIDHISIEEPYSAGRYEREVLSFLKTYFKKNKIALLVGGTGFYIQAVLEGLNAFPRASKEVKQKVANDLEQQGLSFLQDELKEKDPGSFQSLDIQNPRRVVRAIEVIRESGETFSSFKTRQTKDRPFEVVKILLERERSELYERINMRVDQMIKAGLEEEARALYPKADLPALRTVGYQEWFDHFDGKIDRETAIAKIKQHSRNYAKRQLTWFRKREDWHHFHADAKEEVLSFLLDHPLFKLMHSHSREDDQQ
jgi:tRNA dimethylallyltransferase